MRNKESAAECRFQRDPNKGWISLDVFPVSFLGYKWSAKGLKNFRKDAVNRDPENCKGLQICLSAVK